MNRSAATKYSVRSAILASPFLIAACNTTGNTEVKFDPSDTSTLASQKIQATARFAEPIIDPTTGCEVALVNDRGAAGTDLLPLSEPIPTALAKNQTCGGTPAKYALAPANGEQHFKAVHYLKEVKVITGYKDVPDVLKPGEVPCTCVRPTHKEAIYGGTKLVDAVKYEPVEEAAAPVLVAPAQPGPVITSVIPQQSGFTAVAEGTARLLEGAGKLGEGVGAAAFGIGYKPDISYTNNASSSQGASTGPTDVTTGPTTVTTKATGGSNGAISLKEGNQTTSVKTGAVTNTDTNTAKGGNAIAESKSDASSKSVSSATSKSDADAKAVNNTKIDNNAGQSAPRGGTKPCPCGDDDVPAKPASAPKASATSLTM